MNEYSNQGEGRLVEALRRLVDSATRGDPTGSLLWTTLSAAHRSDALAAEGHAANERTVNRLLHDGPTGGNENVSIV